MSLLEDSKEQVSGYGLLIQEKHCIKQCERAVMGQKEGKVPRTHLEFKMLCSPVSNQIHCPKFIHSRKNMALANEC